MKTLMLPEELFPVWLYADSCIPQNAHFEQNPQGRSQSHSVKVGFLLEFTALNPLCFKYLSRITSLCTVNSCANTMVITEGAVLGEKKMPVLWETEKGKQCEEAGKDKDAGCHGDFLL